MKNKLDRYNPAGLVVSGGGVSGQHIEGPLEIIFAGLVGALGGFVFGLLCGALARVFTMNSIKGARGGMHWAAYGASAGALALAMFELLD
jgi:hypothetical protein